LTRDDVDGLRLMRVHIDGEAEVGGQVAADLGPGVAGVIAAHDIPVLLHKEHAGPRRMQGNAMHAVADLRIGVRKLVRRLQAAVTGAPRLAAVVSSEDTRGGDGDMDPLRIAGVQKDCVQAHASRAGLPKAAFGTAQAGKLRPRFAAVGRLEESGVFHSGIDGVRVGQRRFQMPDPLELPGMLRAVVPLVRAGDALIHKLIPDRLPGLAAVIRALNLLPEPAAGLRGINSIGFNR